MANKRTVIATSRGVTIVQKTTSTPKSSITKGQYLNSVLSGNPGEGTYREPEYSSIVPGTIGSRAQGMFLN